MATPPFLTNYFQILNLITTLATTVTCYTLVPIYYPRDYFIRLNIFILVISFIFGTFFIIGKLVKSAGTNDRHVVCLKLARRSLMGCFAMVTLIGVVAKVWVFFIGEEKDLLNLYYHFTVFNIIILCFYTSAHTAIGKFQVTYRPHTGIFFLGAIFHLLTLALAITIALDYKYNYGIIFFQA
ncbi:hypothetical protein GCK72_011341 [Caenorhabditis remanei]|uniref:Uncharacterized protein n=1 Tax=Caenorhabditis remanei TaxID=31234 RepID=A0A6A5H874_CAERE|nr:hypothetical protein GCK72_011341 [Caenorhabditis remanei]KAF1763076.1 hypothetical protein GCK72_011341 [Caenorhabditis remanei]